MKIKLLLIGLFVLLLVGVLYLIWPEWFGFCEKIKTVTRGEICRAPFAVSVGKPSLPFAVGLLVMSILAFFTTRKTFKRWAWFSLWYGIVAAILMFLAMAAVLDVGFLSIPLFDVEKVAYLLAGIYTALSVLILGISDFLVRRRG